jgi:phosphatidylserine decarboxylase
VFSYLQRLNLIQTSGVGTIRSHAAGPEFEDAGFSSDEDDDAVDLGHTSDEDDSPPVRRSAGRLALDLDLGSNFEVSSAEPSPIDPTPIARRVPPLALRGHQQHGLGVGVVPEEPSPMEPTPIAEQRTPTALRSSPRGTPVLVCSPAPSPGSTAANSAAPSPTAEKTPTLGVTPPAPAQPPQPQKGGLIPKILRRPTLPLSLPSSRKFRAGRSASGDDANSDVPPSPLQAPAPGSPLLPPQAGPSRPKPRRVPTSFARKRQEKGYNLAAENDVVGIVLLEIHSAADLPRLKNST